MNCAQKEWSANRRKIDSRFHGNDRGDNGNDKESTGNNNLFSFGLFYLL